jgi:hypothetical protein
MISVEIKGMKELMKKIQSVEGGKYVLPVLEAGGQTARDEAQLYPKPGMANSPDNPARRWYERGYGQRWYKKNGSIGGKQTSETLGKNWHVTPNKSGMYVVVDNRASYAKYVHGEEQAKFHGARGWKKLVETTKENSKQILENMKLAFEQAWKKGNSV